MQLVHRTWDIVRDIKHSQCGLPDELVATGRENIFGPLRRSNNHILDTQYSTGTVKASVVQGALGGLTAGFPA